MSTKSIAATSSFASDSSAPSRARVLVTGIAQLGAAGILAMGAFAKFFNYTDQGSKALADALSVGRGVIIAIGSVEAVAVVLLLLPATRALGALLAAATMAGALFAHATKLGFSGSAVAEMWPLAGIALVLSGIVLVTRWSDLPLIGSRD